MSRRRYKGKFILTCRCGAVLTTCDVISGKTGTFVSDIERCYKCDASSSPTNKTLRQRAKTLARKNTEALDI